MNRETKTLSNRLRTKGFNDAAENEYRRSLLKILNTINNDFIKYAVPLADEQVADLTQDAKALSLPDLINHFVKAYSSPKFYALVNRIARNFVTGVNSHTSRLFNGLPSFAINAYGTKEMRRILNLAIEENAQLIKSIASEHVNSIAKLIYQNIQEGKRSTAMIDDIEQYGVTRSRAKFIARDQTAKVQTSIARTRIRSAGFEYFRWSTSRDERVRPTHRAAEKRVTPYGVGVYRYGDPPKIDGRPLYPGQDYNCRCVEIPVDVEDVEAYQKRKKNNASD